MSVQEQERIRIKFYSEAMRYMDDAKNILKNTPRKSGYYCDLKQVKMACRKAFSGIIAAMVGYLKLEGIQKQKRAVRKAVETHWDRWDFYSNDLSKLNKSITQPLISAYQILYRCVEIDGTTNAKILKHGFDVAYAIIKKIKPKNSIINNQ